MKEAGDDQFYRTVRIFLLVVALGPLLCCAGCLGLAMFENIFPSRAPARPQSTFIQPREQPPVPGKPAPKP